MREEEGERERWKGRENEREAPRGRGVALIDSSASLYRHLYPQDFLLSATSITLSPQFRRQLVSQILAYSIMMRCY